METFWRHQARRTARRINLGRWLEVALPALAGLGFVGGCLLLVFRRNGWALEWLGWGGFGALVGIVVVGLWWMRRHWYGAQAGLVRLEVVHRLHSWLSSAAAGVTPWPEPLPQVRDGLRWNWPRLLGPMVAGVVFFVACALVPMKQAVAAVTAPVEEPPAWAEVEKALEPLKENETADPEALAAIERKLEALRSLPSEQWYQQSSLEASDALRNQTAGALGELGRHLDGAMKALEMAQAPGANPALAANQWGEAMAGLKDGALPLSGEQLAKMAQSLSGLTQEQLKELKKELAQNAQACANGMCQLGDSLAALEAGLTPGMGTEEQGKGGGPGPGGGHEPLGFKNSPKALPPSESTPVAANDPSRLALGEASGQSLGEHDPVRSVAPAAGGAVGSSGKGGEAVWRNDLPPVEQQVLRQFFQ